MTWQQLIDRMLDDYEIREPWIFERQKPTLYRIIVRGIVHTFSEENAAW